MPTGTSFTYGHRMHHMAMEVKDGDDGKGEKNVDRVVGLLMNQDQVLAMSSANVVTPPISSRSSRSIRSIRF